MSESGCAEGGFSVRYDITRTDGERIDPRKGYVVMEGRSGDDPVARLALKFYAIVMSGKSDVAVAADLRTLYGETLISLSEIRGNPQLSADLLRMLRGDWPAQLAQHKDAR